GARSSAFQPSRTQRESIGAGRHGNNVQGRFLRENAQPAAGRSVPRPTLGRQVLRRERHGGPVVRRGALSRALRASEASRSLHCLETALEFQFG
ncbi:hypothetical protein NGA_2051600, partial [Nannochloropsis gaditana CCMP526]|uniref:uncharacterized protein n=1 Tax=Nannochloropsis gaditana (strain CCMP526) TaxID=1093141 RepID=UPI00029F4EFF